MKSIALLDHYLEERNQLLRTTSEVLERDPRVKAAWLFGSIGRGDEDALSDIDLWVVVDDDHIDNIIAQPRQVTSHIGNPVLFLEAPQNAPEGGAYLMTCYDTPVAPHIVDWYWQPQALAYISGQVRLLFDRVGLIHKDQPIQFPGRPASKEIIERPIHFISFFWMMLMITAKKAFRSPWAEKMELLPLLIDSIVKAQHFLGRESILLLRDIPHHQLPSEKVHLLYKLADQMSEMMAIIAEQGQEVPALIKPGAYRYLDLIDSMIEDKGSSTQYGGHEHHLSMSAFSAAERLPRCLGGSQAGIGTRN
ncbi:MAG TPA: nucleotidyltransferase domain-containing protein [Planococcus sp. (in: firmicutes)]|nr:nucleotidyltransferase domain-containing protein [Planococcus sp. (in: firmicutes)]